jgi:glycosyltransferase involved in cell wall biosynthesis
MVAPSVSVCIPAYQAGRYLAETIRSVITQTLTDFELVVVDNGSTDETPEILRSFNDPRIRVIRNDTTLPVAENWNRAVSQCRAPLVKLLCADDLLRPDCLRRQYEVLTATPDVVLACCRRDMIRADGKPIARDRGLPGLTGIHPSKHVIRRVVRHGGNPLGEPCAVMFRRADFDAARGFDARWRYPMDLDLWLRLLERGGFAGIPATLAAFRIAAGSLSASADRTAYVEQRALSAELTSAPHWKVNWFDRMIGAVNAPAARLRRKTLFTLNGR